MTYTLSCLSANSLVGIVAAISGQLFASFLARILFFILIRVFFHFFSLFQRLVWSYLILGFELLAGWQV